MAYTQNKTAYFLAALVLLSVLVRFPCDSLRAGFYLCVRVSAILLFAGYLWQVNRWAALFLCVCLFSHFYPVYTIKSYAALDAVIAGLVIYAVAAKSSPGPLMDALCVAALLQVGWLVSFKVFHADPYQLFGLNIVHKGDFGGLTANVNESGAMLAICLPAFFRKWRWLGLFALPIGFWLSRSSGGALGAATAVLVFVGIRQSWWLAAFIAVWLVSVYFRYVDLPETSQRSEAWGQALHIVRRRWTGIGLGNWKEVYPELLKAGVIRHGFIRLHNTWLQGYIEMGAGFVAVTLGGIAHIARRTNKKTALPAAAIAAVVVCGMANSMFRMNAVNGMFACIWAGIFTHEVNA